MTPELEKTIKVLARYKQLYEQHYGGSCMLSYYYFEGIEELYPKDKWNYRMVL
jgi:hypothetical protein